MERSKPMSGDSLVAMIDFDVSRVTSVSAAGAPTGDGGLGRESVRRALALGARGPRGCYRRKRVVRPDLQGDVSVEVAVGGDGVVRSVRLSASSLAAADVEQCILSEVRGIRFPATGGTGVQTVVHTYQLRPGASAASPRSCSDASRQSLEIRVPLWRERLLANAGVAGAMSVYREAQGACELASWRSRRALLSMMLRHVGGVRGQIALYRRFGGASDMAAFLKRSILRHARTPREVALVKAGLGLDVAVDWSFFSRLWRAASGPEARLRLVRRWLEVIPEDMDLRLRLLALLEQTDRLPEAKRLAWDLRADPLSDARVRSAVGEFWLRQDRPLQARRIFSELVEYAPLDPWARERLGDLYRAHGWSEDAYREYSTLSWLIPGDPSVLLLLARAAADAGRIDQALRFQQRLSETTPVDAPSDPATFARLWTVIRLAHLQRTASEDSTRRSLHRRRRQAGALRDAPELLVALTWSHPEDAPELWVRYPEADAVSPPFERAPLVGKRFGIEAIAIDARDDGLLQFEVRREDEDALRALEAQLTVIHQMGEASEVVEVVDVRLTREARTVRFRLVGNELREVSP